MEGEESEEDLYSGYNYSSVANELEEDPELMRVLRTGYAQRPPIPQTGGGGLHVGTRLQTGGRLMTGIAPDFNQARPVTGVTAAGFTSAKNLPFDPLNQAAKPGSILEKADSSPQATIKVLEKSVNKLIEESAQAGAAGDHQLALDKAKEAGRKERLLCKEKEKANMADQINFDLTYCVLFNIGNQYYINKDYRDALNTYLIIVKNKMFNTGGRLRVNMGNIFMDQKKYPQAIKNYRMALDQTSDAHKAVRLKILQNIGIAFVRMGRYSDAITSFENIMDEDPNFKTALNLMLCYYAISDRDKLKRTFQRSLAINTGVLDDDRYFPTVDDDPHQRLLIEAIKDDALRKIEKERKTLAERTIQTMAKLIAPVIESSFAIGFDWCIEAVVDSNYSDISSELEITKALTFLKQSDIPRAIETFKECGKKKNKMAGNAATNLAFVYILDNDLPRAEKCADTAISLDRYNPLGLVNKGCCLFLAGKFEKAVEYFQEALSVEAICCEALFNLGIAYKRMGQLQKALDFFLKLHAILKNSPQVIYQLADIYDKLEDFPQATEWFMQLVTLVPTDPRVLQRLGMIYDEANDQSQAYQYHYESFRYCPTNIDVISWLGAYYMDSQYADKAIHYFEKAALIQPTQINWQLMVASCHRKTGNYHLALHCYKQIHIRFPDNLDTLKFLVKLCSDLGLKEVDDYTAKLKRAEKLLEVKKQRENSGNNSVSGRKSLVQTASEASRLVSGADSSREASGNRLNSGDFRGESAANKKHDVLYEDPMGALPPRPKTGSIKPQKEEDDFNDELDDDLLPE